MLPHPDFAQFGGFMVHNRRNLLKLGVAGAAAGWSSLAGIAQAQGTIVARVGHLEAPSQPRHKGLERVGALVKERTKGAIEFQLFPSSQLGNARQMIESTQFGGIEGTVMPAAFLGGFNPVISVLDIPYIFPTDRALSQKLREGPFGKALLASFASRGVHALTIWPNGRKSLTSNKPLANLDAFKGQKFRVMDSKILIDQFAAVGATAIAINFSELYTSLQTGLIDGQENPIDTITTMKFHEVQKHMVVTEHGAMEDIVLFSTAFWNRITPEQRDIIAKAFDEMRAQVEEMKEAVQATSIETIKNAKLNVRVADETERKAMGDAMAPKARATYLERAGAEGSKVLAVYDEERKKLGF
jgi:tripartite ATP-independent transporter DctP family solute receptor